MSEEKREETMSMVVLVLGNATYLPEMELRLLSLTEEKESSVDRILAMLEYLRGFLDDMDAIEDESLNRTLDWTNKLRRFIGKFRSFVEGYEGEDEDVFLDALDEWVERHTTT